MLGDMSTTHHPVFRCACGAEFGDPTSLTVHCDVEQSILDSARDDEPAGLRYVIGPRFVHLTVAGARFTLCGILNSVSGIVENRDAGSGLRSDCTACQHAHLAHLVRMGFSGKGATSGS